MMLRKTSALLICTILTALAACAARPAGSIGDAEYLIAAGGVEILVRRTDQTVELVATDAYDTELGRMEVTGRRAEIAAHGGRRVVGLPAGLDTRALATVFCDVTRVCSLTGNGRADAIGSSPQPLYGVVDSITDPSTGQQIDILWTCEDVVEGGTTKTSCDGIEL